MKLDDVQALQAGDALSLQILRDGELLPTFRARVDMTTQRFVRIGWVMAPHCYDVIHKQSPIWQQMIVRKR